MAGLALCVALKLVQLWATTARPNYHMQFLSKHAEIIGCYLPVAISLAGMAIIVFQPIGE